MTFPGSTLRPALLLLTLCACAPQKAPGGAPDAELRQTQQGSGASLLELSGVPAGSADSVTAIGGGSLCGATKLELVLGVNMSADTGRWISDTLAGKATPRTGAVYVPSSAQRVAFDGTVTGVKFPSFDLQSSAPVFFTVTLTTTPAQCTALDAAELAKASQQALAWASRQVLASGFELQLDALVVGKSTGKGTVRGHYANWNTSDFEIEVSVSDQSAVREWIARILKKGTLEEGEYECRLILGSQVLARLTASGLASATSGATEHLQLVNVTVAATGGPADAGP